MLLAACAITRPTTASAHSARSAPGACAASRPPISPERIVIGNTLARVIRNQRETPSITLSGDRFWVRMISPQLRIADVIGASLMVSARLRLAARSLLLVFARLGPLREACFWSSLAFGSLREACFWPSLASARCARLAGPYQD